MKHNVVRLESIEIRNFKNVKRGSLSFENPQALFCQHFGVVWPKRVWQDGFN